MNLILMNIKTCFIWGTAHWFRFPVFVQQLFFSRFFADFDTQYGKLGVFRVEELIFDKNIWLLLAIDPKWTNEIQKYKLFKDIF